jgi:hypothetical protein
LIAVPEQYPLLRPWRTKMRPLTGKGARVASVTGAKLAAASGSLRPEASSGGVLRIRSGVQ